ncbi:hypothetical protein H0H93_008184 [Arthromyces matolae]|nr:hypothetical protein H0H93_008184 [Arthromyces matolae]
MSSFAPPPGTNYIAVIQPGLTFSLLAAFFGGILIPLLIFLFLFTTPAARRHPVFILNVAIVIFGLAFAGLNVGEQWKSMVTPDSPPGDKLIFATIVFDVILPIIIDSVLLFRLLAFYPPMTTPRATFIQVLTFPVLVKCGRLASVTLFLHQMNQTDGQGSIAILAGQLWFRNPYMISEWFLQIADNLYSTLFFFWKLRKFSRGNDKSGFRVQNKSLLAKLRGIFIIALANFVFPLFLNITQLIFIFQDRDYARGTEILLANLYISIFGVLFATVWASARAWGVKDYRNDASGGYSSSISEPGYMRSASETRVGLGSRGKKSPSHYNLSFQDQTSTSPPKEGIRVDQVVQQDVKRSYGPELV